MAQHVWAAMGCLFSPPESMTTVSHRFKVAYEKLLGHHSHNKHHSSAVQRAFHWRDSSTSSNHVTIMDATLSQVQSDAMQLGEHDIIGTLGGVGYSVNASLGTRSMHGMMATTHKEAEEQRHKQGYCTLHWTGVPMNHKGYHTVFHSILQSATKVSTSNYQVNTGLRTCLSQSWSLSVVQQMQGKLTCAVYAHAKSNGSCNHRHPPLVPLLQHSTSLLGRPPSMVCLAGNACTQLDSLTSPLENRIEAMPAYMTGA